MKAVIQRVKYASVKVDDKVIGKIDNGFLVLLGVEENDTKEEAELLARKTANLRIFDDEDGKMNKSLGDFSYSVLVISQFTLIADCKKGNRPSFVRAAKPPVAIPLYETYIDSLKKHGVKQVESGEFGADMKVELLNDGPVTIIFDTDEWK